MRETARSPRSSTGSSSGSGARLLHLVHLGVGVAADVEEEAFWGVGIHSSIVTASLRAVINAVNRAHALRSARDEVIAAFD